MGVGSSCPLGRIWLVKSWRKPDDLCGGMCCSVAVCLGIGIIQIWGYKMHIPMCMEIGENCDVVMPVKDWKSTTAYPATTDSGGKHAGYGFRHLQSGTAQCMAILE